MRKLLITFLFILMLSPVFCQFRKNAIFLGADLNIRSSSQNFTTNAGAAVPGSVTSNSFSLTPGIGLLLSERWMIGVAAGASVSKNMDNVHGYGVSLPRSESYSFAIFSRRYTPIGEKVRIFVEGQLLWNTGSDTYSVFDPVQNATISNTIHPKSFSAGLRPGILYFLTPRLGLEAIYGFVGYTHAWNSLDSYNPGYTNHTNAFGVTLNASNLYIGVRFYLSKRTGAIN